MKLGARAISRAVVEPLEGRVLLSTTPATGSITGVVFDDVSGNGVRDAGERFMPGVSVTVDVPTSFGDDLGDNVVWVVLQLLTKTDATGAFRFDSVAVGERHVSAFGGGEVHADRGDVVVVTVTQGQTSAVDIPVDAFAVVSGQVLKAGRFAPVSQAGVMVYLDENRNGKRDAGEPQQLTTQTGYSFYRVPGGPMAVRLVRVPPHVRAEAAVVRGVAVRGKAVNFDPISIDPSPIKINGTVFIDQNGNNWMDHRDHALDGVKIFLDRNGNGKHEFREAFVFSDSAGRFSIDAPAGKSMLGFVVPKQYDAIGVFSASRKLTIGLDSDVLQLRMGITPRLPE